jgi:hypothetical protein
MRIRCNIIHPGGVTTHRGLAAVKDHAALAGVESVIVIPFRHDGSWGVELNFGDGTKGTVIFEGSTGLRAVAVDFAEKITAPYGSGINVMAI